MISKLERQGSAGFTVRTLRRICEPLDIDLQVYGRWRGGELDRLLDAGHAALQALFARRLESLGWVVRVEVTFSQYGERGSIDLLAFHPATRILLVIEIKTVVADVQGLLRPMDAKVRLATGIAHDLGWEPRIAVPALVVPEESTTRRRIAAHGVLFSRFSTRGWAARRWLRAPADLTTGLLVFVSHAGTIDGRSGMSGRQRVRRAARRAELA